jgi:O-antigen ligase
VKAFLIKYYEPLIITVLIVLLNLQLLVDLSRPLLVFLGAALCLAAFITLISYKQYLLYLLCFSVPLTVPLNVGQAQLNFPSEIICVLLVIYLGFKAINNFRIDKVFLRHPITVLLIIDISWLLLTSSLSIMPMISFKRLLIRVVYILCYYMLFYELYKANSKNIVGIFKTYCIGMIIPIFYTLNFHSQFAFSTQGGIQASRPFYNDHTLYGAVLVFFIPFLVYLFFKKEMATSKKVVWLSMLLLFCVAAFLSYSRAAWASLIAAAGIYLVLKFRVKAVYIWSVIILTGVIVLALRSNISEYLQRTKEVSHKNDVGMHFKSMANVKSDASNAERINRWKCAWRMFLDRPVVGFGPGTYQFVYGKYQLRSDMTSISTFAGNRGHAHSEYFGYLSETGLFGFLYFLALVIWTSVCAIRLIYNTSDNEVRYVAMFVFLGLATFFIHVAFNGFIETDKMAMPVFASIAAIVFLDISSKEKDLTEKSSI